MESTEVIVPVSLLLDPDLTASAKVIWMGLRLAPSATPAELGVKTCLSRHTVHSGIALVSALPPATRAGVRVRVPAGLLAEPGVGAQAKVLYGLLQATADFRGQSGRFTYDALCAMTRLGRNTLKRAIGELAGAGWLKATRKGRLKPIEFTLMSPAMLRSQTEVSAARHRLNRARWGGEAILQEYLSLLIDSDDFADNERPGWLVNPQTGERLEIDRFYKPDFAVEFNGAQHYCKTGRFTQEEADAQHFRDLIKAGLCLYRGVQLVIIHPEDLSLQGVARRIGRRMPLRSLVGHEALIELLEERSLIYRAASPTESA